jgi:hypothetical protein
MLQVRSRQIKRSDGPALFSRVRLHLHDEASFLWYSPLRRSDTLPTEAQRLLAAIREVLQQGILAHGAASSGLRGGDFQNHFQVYKRTGSPCPRCGTPHSTHRGWTAQHALCLFANLKEDRMYDKFASVYDYFVDWRARLSYEMPFISSSLAS